jgi:hypothetical protein
LVEWQRGFTDREKTTIGSVGLKPFSEENRMRGGEKKKDGQKQRDDDREFQLLISILRSFPHT